MSFRSSACPVRTRAARAANAIPTVAIMPICSVFTTVLLMERGAILTLERARNPSHGPFVRGTSGASRAGVGPDACRPSSRRCADAGGDGRKRLRTGDGSSLPRQGRERTPRDSPSRSRPAGPRAAGPFPGSPRDPDRASGPYRTGRVRMTRSRFPGEESWNPDGDGAFAGDATKKEWPCPGGERSHGTASARLYSTPGGPRRGPGRRSGMAPRRPANDAARRRGRAARGRTRRGRNAP